MRRQGIFVATHAEHSDVQIACFLEVTDSFVYNVQKELQASSGDLSPLAKRRKHSQCSVSIRPPKFVQPMQNIIPEHT